MKITKLLLAGLAIAVFSATAAMATNAEEVVGMVREQIGDEVIVNTVRGSPLPKPLNAFEVTELNSSGASNALLMFLTSREAVDPGYVRPPPPSVALGEPPAAPYVTGGADSYVVGEVDYVDSDYITPGVIVTSPPAVIYDTPYYSPGYYYSDYYYPSYGGSSWFFNYGWGGGYWGDRDHGRDRHRHDRPPPPRGGGHRGGGGPGHGSGPPNVGPPSGPPPGAGGGSRGGGNRSGRGGGGGGGGGGNSGRRGPRG